MQNSRNYLKPQTDLNIGYLQKYTKLNNAYSPNMLKYEYIKLEYFFKIENILGG